MQKIISPANKIIVTANKKYQDTVRTASGIVLYQNTDFHPEEFAQIKFKVHSVPRGIIERMDYADYRELPNVGDTILARYDLIFDYKEQPDRATEVYKNLLDHKGEEYWMADVQQVLAVVTTTGFRMLNGYIICDVSQEKRDTGGTILVPEHYNMKIRKDKLIVKYSDTKGIYPGDIVIVSPDVVQHYKVDDAPIYIIRERHICAIV